MSTDKKEDGKPVVVNSAKAADPLSEKRERRRNRKNRMPFGIPVQKMELTPEQKQYFAERDEVPHWFNDEPGRLRRAEGEDYRFVTADEIGSIGQGEDVNRREGLGSKVSMVVGKHDDGSPVTAYLMAIPKEFYDENQMEKLKLVEEKEQSIRQGIDSQGRPGDKEGRYIPRPGISITQK